MWMRRLQAGSICATIDAKDPRAARTAGGVADHRLGVIDVASMPHPAPDAQPPTDILRRAAAAIRKDQDIEEALGHIAPSAYAAWLAVADCLDNEADLVDAPDHWTGGRRFPEYEPRTDLLAVAGAYLGEGA